MEVEIVIGQPAVYVHIMVVSRDVFFTASTLCVVRLRLFPVSFLEFSCTCTCMHQESTIY